METWTIGNTLPTLPDTVLVGHEESPVTWNLDNVNTDVLPFEWISVEGTIESGKAASAKTQILPADLEYFAECNNPSSVSWKQAREAFPNLKNQDSADQPYSEEAGWGCVSTIGSSSEDVDMVAYSQTDSRNPYTGGYSAKGNKNIPYAFHLKPSDHTLLVGTTGWWNMDRAMKAETSTTEGIQTLNFSASRSAAAAASADFHLDAEQTVTITISKAANDDPILSWLAITGTEDAPVADKTTLQALSISVSTLEEKDYTADSWSTLQTALQSAEAVLNSETATQEEVDDALITLQSALDAREKTPVQTANRTLLEESIAYAENWLAEHETSSVHP